MHEYAVTTHSSTYRRSSCRSLDALHVLRTSTSLNVFDEERKKNVWPTCDSNIVSLELGRSIVIGSC